MVAYQRLLGHSHGWPGKPQSVINCFTLAFDLEGEYSSFEGIVVEPDTQFGEAISLGNERGHMQFVPLDRFSPPQIRSSAVSAVTCADVKSVVAKDRDKTYFYLTRHGSNEHVVIKVETGHPAIRRPKKPYEHNVLARQGIPLLVRRGDYTSSAGEVVSREYLWRLSAGDGLLVRLFNGSRWLVEFSDGGKLRFEELEENGEQDEPPRESPEERLIELSWKEACAGDGPRNRDGGRHGLMAIATGLSSKGMWGEIAAHLHKQEQDLRPGVLKHFVAACPIGEDRAWAFAKLGEIAKAIEENARRGFEGKPPNFVRTTVQPAHAGKDAERLHKKWLAEKKRAERRERDRQRRPGERRDFGNKK